MKKKRNGVSAVREDQTTEFFSSGCTVLDCALGGGWAENRIINVVGDSSSGKTLLAEEAAVNFLLKHPNGIVYYHETESAFDNAYARSIGLDPDADNIVFVLDEDEAPIDTVEGFFREFKKAKVFGDSEGRPVLYILDSLDALTDEAEKKRDIGEGSYGTAKAKQLSSFFRQTASDMKSSSITLFIVSQTRQRIGVTFGRRWAVTGGEALKFYSSQRVRLSEVAKMKQTINKITRVVGITVNAFCFKNKVGRPFRDAEFDIKFYYGMDDIGASIQWIVELGNHMAIFESLGLDMGMVKTPEKLSKTKPKKNIEIINAMSLEEGLDIRCKIRNTVVTEWERIEQEFDPKTRKYAGV